MFNDPELADVLKEQVFSFPYVLLWHFVRTRLQFSDHDRIMVPVYGKLRWRVTLTL